MPIKDFKLEIAQGIVWSRFVVYWATYTSEIWKEFCKEPLDVVLTPTLCDVH